MRTRLATILAAAALAGGLTACDAVRDTTNSAEAATEKTTICIDALKLSGFYPNLANPEQAAKDAKETARKLGDLADKAADSTLREALDNMSSKVAELTVEALDPANVASWTKEKISAVNEVSQACL
jgi:hypothetical protein